MLRPITPVPMNAIECVDMGEKETDCADDAKGKWRRATRGAWV
jgi:hypothetical protein